MAATDRHDSGSACDVRLEIDGVTLAGFTEFRGLSTKTNTAEFTILSIRQSTLATTD
jgi:hypothetical protein